MLDTLGDVLATFGLTAVSEMGDKSQLLLIALAARWPKLPVAVGGTVGIAGVQLIAVLIGGWVASSGLGDAMPYVVGVVFITLGLLVLRELRSGDDDEEEIEVDSRPQISPFGAFASTAGLLFMAELGDKTMFTTAALAAVRTPWSVFLGATLAFAVLATIAVLVGAAFANRLPERTLKLIAGVLFLIAGVVTLGLELVG